MSSPSRQKQHIDIPISPISPTTPVNPIPLNIEPPTPMPVSDPMDATHGLQTPNVQRRRPSLIDVDGPGALAPLTELPSVGEVIHSMIHAASSARGPSSVPGSDTMTRTKISITRPTKEDLSSGSDTDGALSDPEKPAMARTDSLLVKIFRDTLRRFTPEPTDLEGFPEEDFDKESTYSRSPRASPRVSPSPGLSPFSQQQQVLEPLQPLPLPPPAQSQDHLEAPRLPRSRRLSWVQLAADTVLGAILPNDAFDINLSASAGHTAKFLGSYTSEDLKKYLVDFGIKDELSKRGFSDLLFKIDTSDTFVNRLTVTDGTLLDEDQRKHGTKIIITQSNFIMDMWVRVKDMRYHDFHAYQELMRLKDGDPGFLLKQTGGARRPDSLLAGADLSTHHVSICDIPVEEAAKDAELMETKFKDSLNCTIVDWLEIQNPHSHFTKIRPPLPGQRAPGLKVARKVVSLILSLAEWKQRDCLSNTPDAWHNAYMYGRRGFQYIDPWMQGFFMAVDEELDNDIAKMGLGPVAWAWKLGHVKRTDSGKTVMWSSTQEQVYPTSSRMRKYFTSDAYLKQVEKARDFYNGKFSIDWNDERVQSDIRSAMGWSNLKPH